MEKDFNEINIKNKKYESKANKLSILLVLLVFIIKLLTILFTNSLLIFSEFLDNLQDFLLIFITYISIKKSSKPADFEHMLGHKKISSVLGIFQSFITIFLYSMMIYKSTSVIFEILVEKKSYFVKNTQISILSIILCLIIDFIIAKRIIAIGKKTNNTSIIAQGINFKGDYLRYFAILIGLIGIYFSLNLLDPILSITFSILIIFESFKVIRKGLNEILDYNPIQFKDLDFIKTEILKIEGVNAIKSFSISNVGNLLHFHIILECNNEITAYALKKINDNIKEKISSYFKNYSCEIYIENSINLEPNTNIKFYEIFDILKFTILKHKEIQEIHNITIDVLNNLILIQLHVKLDSSFSLEKAHEIVTQYEQSAINLIKETLKIKVPINLVTHIEPFETKEKIHSHLMNDLVSNYVYEVLNYIISKLNAIKSYKNIYFFNENEGNYIGFTLLVKKDITIEELHPITIKIEQELISSIPNLKRCVIHTEPI